MKLSKKLEIPREILADDMSIGSMSAIDSPLSTARKITTAHMVNEMNRMIKSGMSPEEVVDKMTNTEKKPKKKSKAITKSAKTAKHSMGFDAIPEVPDLGLSFELSEERSERSITSSSKGYTFKDLMDNRPSHFNAIQTAEPMRRCATDRYKARPKPGHFSAMEEASRGRGRKDVVQTQSLREMRSGRDAVAPHFVAIEMEASKRKNATSLSPKRPPSAKLDLSRPMSSDSSRSTPSKRSGRKKIDAKIDNLQMSLWTKTGGEDLKDLSDEVNAFFAKQKDKVSTEIKGYRRSSRGSDGAFRRGRSPSFRKSSQRRDESKKEQKEERSPLERQGSGGRKECSKPEERSTGGDRKAGLVEPKYRQSISPLPPSTRESRLRTYSRTSSDARSTSPRRSLEQAAFPPSTRESRSRTNSDTRSASPRRSLEQELDGLLVSTNQPNASPVQKPEPRKRTLSDHFENDTFQSMVPKATSLYNKHGHRSSAKV